MVGPTCLEVKFVDISLSLNKDSSLNICIVEDFMSTLVCIVVCGCEELFSMGKFSERKDLEILSVGYRKKTNFSDFVD